MYDPQSDKITEYGLMANRPTHWGVYTMEVAEPSGYCGMANQGKWFLSVLDTRTGQKANFFDEESGQPKSGGSVVRSDNGEIRFGPFLLQDGKPLMDDQGKPAGPPVPKSAQPLDGNRSWPNSWKVFSYGGPEDEARQAGLEFDLTRIHPDGTVERVRKLDTKGRIVFDGKTMYLHNGGRAASSHFAHVVRIRDLFAE